MRPPFCAVMRGILRAIRHERAMTMLLLASWIGLETARGDDSNQFPSTAEVLDGRSFQNPAERELFFLQQIRQKYPQHWPSLVEANISIRDYEAAPEKMLRFIQQLGSVTAGTDDAIAITNLGAINSSPAFYADTNAYRPEILKAAATALVEIGPRGRRVLADAFSESHYRADPATLELVAEVIGHLGSSDTNLTAALAQTAFTLTATNGGSYPHCTLVTTRVLARLPGGAEIAVKHLQPGEVFKDPGRFQAVIDGLAAVRAVGLTNHLSILSEKVSAKLKTLDAYRGPYYDDLAELQTRITNALVSLTPPH